MTSDPHERIVDVARDLFCRDGIHATGIDRILEAAGASKMTLYSRFGSKQALIQEVLTREGSEWREAFFAQLRAASDDPRERLRAVVPALRHWFTGGRFYGCAFMNAVAEHAKGEMWLRLLAREHHGFILGFFAEQAEAASYPNPALMARQLLLLMEGTIAALMVSGDESVLDVAAANIDAVLAR